MRSLHKYKFILALFAASLIAGSTAFGQNTPQAMPTHEPKFRSQEISEEDGYPVVMKNLPRWEKVRAQARFAADRAELEAAIGQRPILYAVELTAGAEAAIASYPAGTMVLVEFPSPQASIETDGLIAAVAAADPSIAYRRIGNYNVVVLDVPDRSAAEALIDEVTYEKQIQWLGDNPFLISAEKAFIMTTRDIFVATVMWILLGFAIAIITGIITGWIYFRMRVRRRAGMSTFTDAGGMTRLNLDGYTPDPSELEN
jgi:hypothetical protein